MIVGCAVFALVLTVGTDLLIKGLRTTSSGERRQVALDQCRGFMYRISDELRKGTEILDPSPESALYMTGTNHIVFRTRDEVVGYRLVDQGGTQVIERRTYAYGYDSKIPGTQVALDARYLTTDPTTLNFAIIAGGVPPGQDGSAGDGNQAGGVAVALGTVKETVQVYVSLAPPEMVPVTMRTKKTLWAGLFPSQKTN